MVKKNLKKPNSSQTSTAKASYDSQAPLFSNKPKRRSRSLSPALSLLASNIGSASKDCVNKTFCRSRKSVEFEDLDESILNSPERERYIRDTFYDNKAAHYREYFHHTSDMHKLFRKEIADERNFASKCHKDDIAKRDHLNLLINKLMQNHVSSSNYMSDEEKRVAFDALVDLQRQKKEHEEKMMHSLIQTESRDEYTESLIKEAEQEKRKQSYKRITKVIEQELNSLDSSTPRGSSKARFEQEQKEREEAIINLARDTMYEVKRIEDRVRREVLEKDGSANKKKINKKIRKEVGKENAKRKKEMRKMAREFTNEGNFIGRAFRTYKERREWNRPYKKQMKKQKKMQKKITIMDRIRNLSQRFQTYLEVKFSNDDEVLKTLFDKDATLSLHDKMIIEQIIRRNMTASMTDTDDSSQSDTRTQPAAASQSSSNQKPTNQNEAKANEISKKRAEKNLPSPKKKVRISSPAAKIIDDSYLFKLFPEVPDHKINNSTESSSHDSYFEGELPDFSENNVGIPKNIDVIKNQTESSTEYSGELPSSFDLNKHLVKVDIEPELDHKSPKRRYNKYISSISVSSSLVDKIVESGSIKDSDRIDKICYASPTTIKSQSAKELMEIHHAVPAYAESEKSEYSMEIHYAVPARIESVTSEQSEKSSEKMLEVDEMMFSNASIKPDQTTNTDVKSAQFQKYIDSQKNMGILDVELTPDMQRAPLPAQTYKAPDLMHKNHGSSNQANRRHLTLSDLDQMTTSSSNKLTSDASSPCSQGGLPPVTYFSQPIKETPSNSGNVIFDKTIKKLVTNKRKELIPTLSKQTVAKPSGTKEDSSTVAKPSGTKEDSPMMSKQTVAKPSGTKEDSPMTSKQTVAKPTGAKEDSPKEDADDAEYNRKVRKMELQLEEHQKVYKKMQHNMEIRLHLQLREIELQDWRDRWNQKTQINEAWRQGQEIQKQKDLMEKQKDRINRQKVELDQLRENRSFAQRNQTLNTEKKLKEKPKQHVHQQQNNQLSGQEIRERAFIRRQRQKEKDKEIRDIQDKMLIQRTLEKKADLLRIDQEYALSSLPSIPETDYSGSTTYHSVKSAFKCTSV